MKTTYPYTIDNGHGELLTFKGLTQDAAFLLTRYRTEFGMIDMPAVVRRIVMPIVYATGTVLGKYAKFKDAPAPVPANRMR